MPQAAGMEFNERRACMCACVHACVACDSARAVCVATCACVCAGVRGCEFIRRGNACTFVSGEGADATRSSGGRVHSQRSDQHGIPHATCRLQRNVQQECAVSSRITRRTAEAYRCAPSASAHVALHDMPHRTHEGMRGITLRVCSRQVSPRLIVTM